MLANGSGAIVNVASTLSFVAMPGAAALRLPNISSGLVRRRAGTRGSHRQVDRAGGRSGGRFAQYR
jgi:hypothetical protein